MIIPLEFPLQDSRNRDKYARLLPFNLQSALEGENPFFQDTPLLANALIIDETPVGIVLASFFKHLHLADIHCLVIDTEHASLDLVKSLVEAFIQRLRFQDINTATMTYTKEESLAPLIEKVFQDLHWKGPQSHILECHFISAEFNTSWLYKEIPLEEGFEEFPFKEITPLEEKDLKLRFEQGTIPDYIYPFGKDRNLIEYNCSVGLRYKNQVIGWMVTHRLTPELMRYSALYIEDEFIYTGYWIKLLSDAIKAQQKNIPEATYTVLEINVEQIPSRWLKFVERRLVPKAYKVRHKNIFWKSLNA